MKLIFQIRGYKLLYSYPKEGPNDTFVVSSRNYPIKLGRGAYVSYYTAKSHDNDSTSYWRSYILKRLI